MIKLDDLKNIDLKNLNLANIVDYVFSKKEILVIVIISGVSLLVLIGFVNTFFFNANAHNEETLKLSKKKEVIAKYESGQKNLKKFIASFPASLSEDALSSLLVEKAQLTNIEIQSFVPVPIKLEGLSEVISVSLDLRAKTYKDFLNFIKLLEEEPVSLKVDNSSLTSDDASRSRIGEEKIKTGALKAHLELSSVNLKK